MARSDCLSACGCPDCCCCSCCCKKAEITFKCGSPRTSEFPAGCECGSSLRKLTQENNELGIDIEFDSDSEFNFPEFEPIRILSNSCSIPCQPVTVSLSATCCLKCGGSGGVIAVGPGWIGGSASGGGDCAPIILTLNGSSSAVHVEDGDFVKVDVTSGNTDCDCCCFGWYCKDGKYPNCNALTLFAKYTYRNGKIRLNRSYLKDALNLARQIKYGKIKPTNRKIEVKKRPITKRKLMF